MNDQPRGFWGIASSHDALGFPPHPSGWNHLRRAGVVTGPDQASGHFTNYNELTATSLE